MGRHLSPRHGQVMLFRIPRFDHNMDVQYQVAPELPNSLESVRLNIGSPVVRTDGRSGDRYTVT